MVFQSMSSESRGKSQSTYNDIYISVNKKTKQRRFLAVFLIVIKLSGDPRHRFGFIFASNQKLIKSRLVDGLQMVTFFT